MEICMNTNLSELLSTDTVKNDIDDSLYALYGVLSRRKDDIAQNMGNFTEGYRVDDEYTLKELADKCLTSYENIINGMNSVSKSINQAAYDQSWDEHVKLTTEKQKKWKNLEEIKRAINKNPDNDYVYSADDIDILIEKVKEDLQDINRAMLNMKKYYGIGDDTDYSMSGKRLPYTLTPESSESSESSTSSSNSKPTYGGYSYNEPSAPSNGQTNYNYDLNCHDPNLKKM